MLIQAFLGNIPVHSGSDQWIILALFVSGSLPSCDGCHLPPHLCFLRCEHMNFSALCCCNTHIVSRWMGCWRGFCILLSDPQFMCRAWEMCKSQICWPIKQINKCWYLSPSWVNEFPLCIRALFDHCIWFNRMRHGLRSSENQAEQSVCTPHEQNKTPSGFLQKPFYEHVGDGKQLNSICVWPSNIH